MEKSKSWRKNGVNTGNERYVLFLIQDAKGLIKAREHLKTTSYYDNWSEEYYKKITLTELASILCKIVIAKSLDILYNRENYRSEIWQKQK